MAATGPCSVPWQPLGGATELSDVHSTPGSPRELRLATRCFRRKSGPPLAVGGTSVLRLRAEYAPGAGSLWSYRGRALLGGPGGGGGNTNPGLLSEQETVLRAQWVLPVYMIPLISTDMLILLLPLGPVKFGAESWRLSQAAGRRNTVVGSHRPIRARSCFCQHTQ